MTTGENIKRLRKQQNLTQTELATQIRSHQQIISKWENNEAAPTYELARKMAIRFNVPISEICDEYSEDPRQVIPEEGMETVTKDVALDYIDWNQKQGNRSVKATFISFSCMTVALIACELAKYGIPGFIVLIVYLAAMIVALCSARRIGLKKEVAAFTVIESGDFHLDSDAEKMVMQRKTEIKESVQLTGNIATGGLLVLLLWFFDSALDAGWVFTNQMVIVYLVGFGLIMSICMPTLNYWHSIRKLLHEKGPQILTPFDKAFWKK